MAVKVEKARKTACPSGIRETRDVLTNLAVTLVSPRRRFLTMIAAFVCRRLVVRSEAV